MRFVESTDPGQLTIGDCPDLSITTQPVDGYITRCMATANENGSEGPFYVIVSTEIDPHIGNFTFSWFNDGVPVESTYAGTFAVRSTLVQTNGFFSRVILIRPDARDAGHYQCLISSDDACDSPLSAATNIVTVSFCPADFDCDGTADFFDYDAFVTCFEGGFCVGRSGGDIDADGYERACHHMPWDAAQVRLQEEDGAGLENDQKDDGQDDGGPLEAAQAHLRRSGSPHSR
mgnify:CR=1 FL=1